MDLREVLELARDRANHNDWLAAASAYAAAAGMDPQDHRLLTNQGYSLWLEDLAPAAELCYRRALRVNPNCPVALCGLAHCLRDQNRFEQASALYRTAGGDEADWALSQVLIGLEQYPEAYERSEARFRLSSWEAHLPPPYWGGDRLRNWPVERDLVVWSEQGLGDTLQYLRWIPVLSRERDAEARTKGVTAGELTLLVPQGLVAILREGLAWMANPPLVMAMNELVVEAGACHGPLMSLPHELGGAPNPDHSSRPTLRSPLWNGINSELLRSGDPNNPQSPVVGLVWASGQKLETPFTRREYLRRSLPPRALWRLLDGLLQAGVQVVPLQFGADTELPETLGIQLSPPPLPIDNFASVARLVTQMDLVISVDTAMAHLVGSMGEPCWVLLPWGSDPRWLRDRTDSPWYPSLKLYRQPEAGDWSRAIDQLLSDFIDHFAAGGS
jgi:hypothetical protein